jgi:hypothetical protein
MSLEKCIVLDEKCRRLNVKEVVYILTSMLGEKEAFGRVDGEEDEVVDMAVYISLQLSASKCTICHGFVSINPP